ncbi:hypothetical protein JW752_00905 [Candidatus Peregrinibacteria bacterium]|nr:hypothetical protein [Candidatus Peregrinibacteria bacterium]
MTEHAETITDHYSAEGSLSFLEVKCPIEEMRLDFVRRCRLYIKNAVINPRGPLSNDALRYIAEQRGFDFLAHAHCYQDRSCYDELLETAAKSSVMFTPWKTLEHAALFAGYKWEEEVLLKAGRRCRGSRTLYELAPLIKNEVIRKKVLTIATRRKKKGH